MSTQILKKCFLIIWIEKKFNKNSTILGFVNFLSSHIKVSCIRSLTDNFCRQLIVCAIADTRFIRYDSRSKASIKFAFLLHSPHHPESSDKTLYVIADRWNSWILNQPKKRSKRNKNQQQLEVANKFTVPGLNTLYIHRAALLSPRSDFTVK